MANLIVELGEKVLDGKALTREDAVALSQIDEVDVPLLAAYAHKIRAVFAGKTVELCGIINARSGLCSEDCKFCAQSVHHQTSSPVYPLLTSDKVIEQAEAIIAAGAKRASLVTSGKGMDHDPDFSRILMLLKDMMEQTELKVCANLGTLTLGQAKQLAALGVKRYAHNLETSERFYPRICTSHPYEARFKTIQAAKQAGMELCCGGIIGLGETWQDRIDLAFTLKELDVDSIPINILNPIPGTRLEGQEPLPPLEILQTFAIFRFILPGKVIRPAGGREINLRDMQGAMLLSGANGLIIGNYLTFKGRNTADDVTLVEDAGLLPI